jgi:putative transposase
MAPPRLFVPGLSHHVIHRGNNRCSIFVDDHDRRRFLSLLGSVARESDVDVHGYVLMRTHHHLLVTARHQDALPHMMQVFGGNYVRYFNKRYQRTGTLWEGRYRASLIGDQRYWLTCLRYIEMNPVRACVVVSPEQYEWSSSRAHTRCQGDPLLTPHRLYEQLGPDAASRASQWSAFCGHPTSEAELSLFRNSTLRGRGLGMPADDQNADNDHIPNPAPPHPIELA